MKILILKPSSLGDVVQALPVLRLLRRGFPGAEIYWWIAKELAPLLEGDPDLTGIYPFQRRGWTRPMVWLELLAQVRSARERRFDWVLDLQGLARSGAFGWLARGKLVIGLDDMREGAPGFYDRTVRRRSFDTHAVDWYLDVLRALEVPVDFGFDWMPRSERAEWMLERRWPAGVWRWVVVHPGARWPNKRWPAEYYKKMVEDLAKRDSALRFVIIGGNSDLALGREVASATPARCLDLTGQTSLVEMVEWVRRSSLMVTNDTGPMHVAAALRKPLVALFGPTTPLRTGPYGQLESVLTVPLSCAPCLKPVCRHLPEMECLTALLPSMAVEAAWKKLERWTPR